MVPISSNIDYDKVGDILHPSALSSAMHCHFDCSVKRHLSACSQVKKAVKGSDVILRNIGQYQKSISAVTCILHIYSKTCEQFTYAYKHALNAP